MAFQVGGQRGGHIGDFHVGARVDFTVQVEGTVGERRIDARSSGDGLAHLCPLVLTGGGQQLHKSLTGRLKTVSVEKAALEEQTRHIIGYRHWQYFGASVHITKPFEVHH